MKHLFSSLILFLAFQGIAQEATSSLPAEITAQISSAETFDLQSLIEPPMELSQELPISLSYANKKDYIQNPELLDKEAKNNAILLKNKAFPWLFIIAAFVVFFTILLIRFMPSKLVDEKVNLQTKEKIDTEIKQELQKMTLTVPKDVEEADTFLMHLDFLLRRYLQNKYQFPAFTFTKEELIAKTNALDDLTPSLKEGMSHTFKLADQMKFAKLHPNSNDCQNLIDVIRQLLIY